MLSQETLTSLLRIRRFEERLLKLFDAGKLSGTTHTCIGQEAVPVAVMPLLRDDDFVFSNHRGHGHYLARFNDMEGLLAEIMGREGAVCGGVGGSQHIRRGNYFSTGVQGESVPVAVGVAWALKRRGAGDVAVAFIGDGTWGQGAVYEALNMAALWQLPLIVVVENNEIAQTTLREHSMAGTIEGRASAFGVRFLAVPSAEAEECRGVLASAFQRVRAESAPLVIEFMTRRLGSHSKGDDTRARSVIDELRANDWYAAAQAADAEAVRAVDELVTAETERLVADVASRPLAGRRELPPVVRPAPGAHSIAPGERVVDNLNRALHALMRSDARYVLIGEDLLDPYGGAFKVARGLSSAYPDRVVSTPISELGIAGMGNGMAMAGQRPIVEFMFGDFIFLAFDQIINVAAKTVTMYGEHRAHPILFRCPVGGHRGYGATHSQSVQKHFIGIPNLDLYEMSPLHDCSAMLPAVFDTGNPAILFESKVMYPQPMLPAGKLDELFAVDFLDPWTARVSIDSAAKVLLIAPGGMFNMCWKAARTLFLEYEIEVAVVVPFRLYPFDATVIGPVVTRAEAIFTVEEGGAGGTWGSEVASVLSREYPDAPRAVGIHSADAIIPSALHLESLTLLTPEAIVRQVAAALGL